MLKITNLIPIKKNEFSRFVTIACMMILILFIYSIERSVKDTIIVGDSSLGPEAISAIKLFGTLPAAIVAIIFYIKLSNTFNRTTIFYIFNFFFTVYFLFFSLVIQKNPDYFFINLSGIKDFLPNMKYFISSIEKWYYSLYYIFAELWGSIMLSLIFWQTANQIFKIEEAKRLYPLLGFFAQLGMLSSGCILNFLSDATIFSLGWNQTVEYVNYIVFISSITLAFLYWLLTNKFVDKTIINTAIVSKKKKAGMIESFKYILKSKYIALIAIIIICYGISINIVEGVWKAYAAVIYPDKQQYSWFMSNLQTYTAIMSMIFMLLGSYLLKKISWRAAAMITPIAVMITGVGFFIFSSYQEEIKYLMPFITVSPIFIAVIIGLIQNIIAKGVKYSFFDSTKEIAYMPLDEDLKSKGKATADVIGGRFGKSGGAFIQQSLLLLIPGATLITLSSTLFIFFLIITSIWIIAVYLLNKEYIQKK